nr:MAG TPA: hypothetical protein [Caudoviricetes sp.]
MLNLISAFIIGFVFAVIILLIASEKICKFLAKSGKYASATWDSKKQRWNVRGHYLAIGGKINQHLNNQEDEKVKYRY